MHDHDVIHRNPASGDPRATASGVVGHLDMTGYDAHHASVPNSISCNPLPLGTIGYTCSLGSTKKSTSTGPGWASISFTVFSTSHLASQRMPRMPKASAILAK